MTPSLRIACALLIMPACTEYDLGRDKDDPVVVDDTGGPRDTAGDSEPPVDTGEPPDSDPPIDETGLPPVASAPLYAHSANTLFSVEPEAPFGHLRVGAFVDASGQPVTDITDVAIDADGIMYAVSFDKLYTVNPENGQVTRVATAGPTDLNALTFLADGTLLAGGGGNLYEVDPSSGAFTQISSIGDWLFAGDMVGLPDGLLYCAMSNDSTGWESALVVYDLASQTIIRTGTTGTGSMYGFAYAEGTLFGFNALGEILTIDPTSGRATRVADTNEVWWGATTNPVTW
jgi:hypothetical protein